MTEKRDEIMELAHEEVPGYRKIFYVLITIASAYLGLILFNTL